jgi:hypothetical protein
MISLQYRLTDPAILRGWEHDHDVATAARQDLWWSGFPGDIRIVVDDAEIVTDFGWVPLLHFAASLLRITKKLAEPGGEATYTFTEADEVLRFDRARDLIEIEASFSPVTLSTTYPDLLAMTIGFGRHLLTDLAARNPGLDRNPAIIELRDRLQS